LWIEAEIAKSMGNKLKVDMSYFEALAEEAKNAIDMYGPFAHFVR
jgi:hypothetical protein